MADCNKSQFPPYNARDWVDRLAVMTHGLFTTPETYLEPPIGEAHLLDNWYPIGVAYLLDTVIPYPLGTATVV